ncbi:heavy-metal-associated domain-containing protein [Ferruginibacter sp. HRS2-29]|uniref:heavy-metal-associated domain-containing protein n=1 Tax=Ferruginibacter sp. HRS2-29 TaxID=2487334 RepID=UPI0020CE1D8D|nr:heavy-metal-associated domain-containing protein [Ferruginibacter sp. HRS2-29]MCP9750030.1 copper chaperone [Ferruginibacter sp. HRS2-29]
MKNIFLAIAILFSFSASAQVTKVTLQASGLTCSMCSNSINKALQSLPSVEKVMANIRTSSFDITFKPGANIDFDELKNKVEDAGFFVAKLTATVQFNNQAIKNDEHIQSNGLTLHFLNVKDQTLSGTKTIQVLDKGYVSAKEFKKNELYTKMECYKTGVAGTCCSKGGMAKGARIYHVTI